MRVCLFEDSKVSFLEPVALTRPAFALRCGAATVLDRIERWSGASEVGVVVRPHLIDLCRLQYPAIVCNDAAWRGRDSTIYVNARWFAPCAPLEHLDRPRVGLSRDQVAYVIGAVTPCPDGDVEAVDAWVEDCRKRLPPWQADGLFFDYLWDVVNHNGAALSEDAAWFTQRRALRWSADDAEVMGPRERFLVADGSAVEPFVSVDTRGGPVLVDRGAVVQSFTRLEGPCYVGPDSLVLGAKVRAGTTIGPCCRVGGEVEASIFQGFSNKYHDGFLGHSYLGEWVNLAAGTQTSDLRNDYGLVRTTVHGVRINTRSSKVGSFIGDHTKTALGALLNTGSVIGVFANVLPNGALSPQVVPSFCQTQHGQIQERWDMQGLLTTAATVMKRRGQTLTDAHRELYFHLFDDLAELRHKTVREAEIRRLRKSV